MKLNFFLIYDYTTLKCRARNFRYRLLMVELTTQFPSATSKFGQADMNLKSAVILCNTKTQKTKNNSFNFSCPTFQRH